MKEESTEELKREIKRLRKELERYQKHKYGLVWMEREEEFDIASKNRLPILREVKEKAITNEDGKPTHIIIEGDNYHALTCLNYTHKEKVDLIYIDPPYNTGNKDFKYNDTFIDKESPFRHSAWLSFMSKRLWLAKNLLKKSGVIFISIDDNEVAQLKLLCDEVFQGKNFIAKLPTIMNLKGNQDEFGFAGTHEYTLVYGKDIDKVTLSEFSIDDEEMEKWEEDEYGYFKKGAPTRATGEESMREDRQKMFYPILVRKDTLKITTHISNDEYKGIYNKETDSFDDTHLDSLIKKYEKEYHVVLPINDEGKYSRWRWGWSEKNKVKMTRDILVNTTGKAITLYKKQRPEISDLVTKKPKSIFYKPEYSSGNGTGELKAILGSKQFSNPKPLALIIDFLVIGSKKNPVILDFFAGSGTTLQAAITLNAEDENKRQCILVNSNSEKEGFICETITYERNKRVIEGYTKPNGEKVEGLGNSLKYYRTDYVGKNQIEQVNDEDQIELCYHAGELLALAENTLYEVFKNEYYQIFADLPKKGKHFTAIYFQENLSEFEEFEKKVAALKAKVTAYIFSWSEGEFDDVFDAYRHVAVKSIPQPILEIYKNILSA